MKQEVVEDVKEWFELVLETDELDPPMKRKATLVQNCDNHYVLILRKLGEMD